jgi:hypothetical protein
MSFVVRDEVPVLQDHCQKCTRTVVTENTAHTSARVETERWLSIYFGLLRRRPSGSDLEVERELQINSSAR